MTRIETVAEVGPDRRLSIELPPDVAEGTHRVVVLLLEENEGPEKGGTDSDEGVGNLEWEGSLLVYNGPMPPGFDIRRFIERDREERMIDVMVGGDG